MKSYMKQYGWNLALAVVLLIGVAAGAVDPATAVAGGMLLTTTAQLGNGTVLSISAGSPTAFITVANAHDIAWDNGTNPEVEVTNLQSVSKEFLAGLPDAGTLTATIDLDMGDPGQAAIHAAKLSRVACDIKVVLPAGTTPSWTARGFVKKFDKQTGVDNAVKANFEFRVTGPWTAA